jgi:hypothetical protein
MINRYERGQTPSRRFFQSDGVKALALALDVNPLWLMTGKQEPFAPPPLPEEYDRALQATLVGSNGNDAIQLWNAFTNTDPTTQALISALLESSSAPWMTAPVRLSLAATKAVVLDALQRHSSAEQ